MKKRALFMSADKDFPHCSFHELGLLFNKFFSMSNLLDVTFFDAATSNPFPKEDINSYDLAFFNYHFQVWRNYKKEFFDNIRIPKILINYETRYYPWESPTHLQGLRIKELFGYQIIPDFNIDKLDDDSVLLLPRVVDRADFKDRPINIDNPVISTYGLPHGDKDVVGSFIAIQEEFDTATFRIHFAADSRGTNAYMKLLYEECVKIKKPGINIEFSEDFKTTEALSKWLNESDLNIFFYHPHRDEATMGTFPGSIDDAITAQRPIAVRDMLCTRYITSYIEPYPRQSLKEIMINSLGGVKKMYKDGDPKNAMNLVDNWVKERF